MTEPNPVVTPIEETPPRRRGCLFKILIALGGVVVLIVGLITTIVVYSRTHQSLDLPADGQTIATAPPVTDQDGTLRYTSLSVQQGVNRRVVEFVLPVDVAPGERLPVVVLLHGHSGNGGLVTDEGDWKPAVAADRFMLVTPEGVEQSWNAGACCRLASTLGVDDDAFLDVIVNDLRRRPEVDPSRIFMVGESNGGIMVYRYLCDHAAKLAGAASVVGTNIEGCPPDASIPVMHVAGTADAAVPYRGGRTAISIALASRPFPPVVASVEAVAKSERCADPPTVSDQSQATIREWSGCRDASTVRLVTVDGGTHTWPKSPAYDTTPEILKFFGITS